MTIVPRSYKRTRKYRPNIWFEKLMALVAVINLIIVGFDLSYVPLRDFWLSGQVTIGGIKSAYIKLDGVKLDLISEDVSRFITQYDAVKGIIPNRDTEEYLDKVAQLRAELTVNGVDTPVAQNLFGDIRRRSIEIVQTDAFSEANKTGNLERIKNRMRSHLPNKDNSAKTAFWQYWTVKNFQGKVTPELEFFDREIKPLFETNYYRVVGENGGYVDYFGFIDFPFGIFFAVEFLGRTWLISRRHINISWLDAMLWRWYDFFFFIPGWRWLRVIPVTVRLNQAQIINLNSIQKQLSQGLVAGIAEDITEVVIIRLINQIQSSIRNGDISRLLSQQTANPYVDINNTNETAEIIRILAKVIADRVLPAIQPEAESLLQYSVDKAIRESPAYRGIKLLPGGDRTIINLSNQLISQTYSAFSSTLQAALAEDEQFDRLLESLVSNLGSSLSNELQAQQSMNKIELLLIDLLEEIKINYVERLSQEDIEDILEQTRSLRNISHKSPEY
ncbi:hypothetical protein I4641_00390 [Waterburya agarophytonicola K14]|uniref:Uncharacterized protein n=1 Tax=Waterburya agarophytonicola KI4 TaxID=2874699 RepID=A0A964FFG1_9CYAN|nr:hypothetical protein [Waterburya agarophytonicola]MCC0175438.1 hypothetical protein [Waterburya agarophytonicola KI4]